MIIVFIIARDTLQKPMQNEFDFEIWSLQHHDDYC